jgi:hypothetical protein
MAIKSSDINDLLEILTKDSPKSQLLAGNKRSADCSPPEAALQAGNV